MMERLRFLRQAQWWKPERLEAERACRLGHLLAVAYREVPFYRSLFGDMPAPADLACLPVATKAALRAGYPHSTTRNTGQRFHESCSSGSTGANFCVREDAETAGWHRASFLLAMEWSGWRLGEPHLQTGMTSQRGLVKWVKDRLMRCAYVSAFDLSDAALDRVLQLLDRRGITHVWGYPGSLYYFARRAIETGWNLPLCGIVTWGDTLYTHYRQTIERAFGAHVLDTYGIGEGMQVSAQCEERNLYHIHALDVIVECVDDAGLPVPPGQPGHLLLTRLHPGPMPLIRYRVGDLGVMSDRSCPCGRGFFVMESIQGRDTDVVVTPSGNRLIVHFFTGILIHFPEIESFQVVQESTNAILVRVVPSNGFCKDTANRIVSTLRDKGADLEIEVEAAKTIPIGASGKRRFVINRMVAPEAA
jgi:phenylacetate-CoA ligase